MTSPVTPCLWLGCYITATEILTRSQWSPDGFCLALKLRVDCQSHSYRSPSCFPLGLSFHICKVVVILP